MRKRSRARGWALQVLYAWESRSGTLSIIDLLREFEEERLIAVESRGYLRELIQTVANHIDTIDLRIQGALTNWRIERLSAIDRNILRLATAELLYLDEIPPLVSIQQAMALAERYGTAESPRFINGVLDALLGELRGSGGAQVEE